MIRLTIPKKIAPGVFFNLSRSEGGIGIAATSVCVRAQTSQICAEIRLKVAELRYHCTKSSLRT